MTQTNYQTLLDEKTLIIKQLFDDIDIPEITVFSSPEQHFRMRAEFRIWHTGNELNYVMFKKGEKNTPIKIFDFPNASKIITTIMNPLLEEIQLHEILSHKLFQIDFLSTTTNQLLITLLYHKQLDENWETCAKQLQEKINSNFADLGIESSSSKVFLLGRARKQKIVLSEESVIEKMQINDKTFQYQQVENSFTQPNAYICQKMLTWAVDHTKNNTGETSGDLSGDLVELYCGNGNFTLPLAQNFNRVLATEVSKTSVKSAQFNIALNEISNVDIVRLSSEEFTQALNKTRVFRRLADINLDDYKFSTIFVDPPRAGLDDETLKLVSQFDTIIYISCNPSTLIENIKKLSELTQYTIKHFAIFDQFPFTDHIESGLILKKASLE